MATTTTTATTATTSRGVPSARVTGTVRWFSHKGFGFIAMDDGPDVYVHHAAIVGHGFRTLPTGATVEFRIRPTARGPEAADVVVTDDV
ncbi:MAG: cold shock domain-containing protein [Actinobacteria bacterium]|nr:cold shock domain-containing protein [Actinomycetota bacterium]